MSALCPNDKVTAEEVKLIESLFNSFGRAEVVPESMMDAVVGVSGSSPAYVYMFIEAMAVPLSQMECCAPRHISLPHRAFWCCKNGFRDRKTSG